jgi:hypothetical protein
MKTEGMGREGYRSGSVETNPESGEIGGAPSFDPRGPEDADFVEEVEGGEDEDEGVGIGTWGDTGGDDEEKDEGVSAVIGEEGAGDEAEPGEDHENEGEFERESAGEHEVDGETEIFLDGPLGGRADPGVEIHADGEGGGQDEGVTESDAGEEEKPGGEGTGDEEAAFGRVEGGEDELAQEKEDEREGDHEAADKGDLDDDVERIGDLEGDEKVLFAEAPFREHLGERGTEEVEDRFEEGGGKGHADRDGGGAFEQRDPEVGQVFQKRFFAVLDHDEETCLHEKGCRGKGGFSFWVFEVADEPEFSGEREAAEAPDEGDAFGGGKGFQGEEESAGSEAGGFVTFAERGPIGGGGTDELFKEPTADGAVGRAALDHGAEAEEHIIGVDPGLEFERAGELFGLEPVPAGAEGEGGVEAVGDLLNEGDEKPDVAVGDGAPRIFVFEGVDEVGGVVDANEQIAAEGAEEGAGVPGGVGRGKSGGAGEFGGALAADETFLEVDAGGGVGPFEEGLDFSQQGHGE